MGQTYHIDLVSGIVRTQLTKVNLARAVSGLNLLLLLLLLIGGCLRRRSLVHQLSCRGRNGRRRRNLDSILFQNAGDVVLLVEVVRFLVKVHPDVGSHATVEEVEESAMEFELEDLQTYRRVLPLYRQIVQRNAFTPPWVSMWRRASVELGLMTSQIGHLYAP